MQSAMEFLAITVAVAAALASVAEAAQTFKVGGSSGWDLNASGYQSWASSNTFHVGDRLAFVYGGTHSVVETDSAGYQSCSASNSIMQDNSGNTVVTLKTPGKHYFICGTPGHCSAGMKLAVNVLSSSSSSSSPSESPSTPATSSSTPAATTSSSPAKNTPSTDSASAAPALGAGRIAAFLGAAVCFLAVLL